MQSLRHSRMAYRLFNQLMPKDRCKAISHTSQHVTTRTLPISYLRTLRTLNPNRVRQPRSLRLTEENVEPNAGITEITESDDSNSGITEITESDDSNSGITEITESEEFLRHIKTVEDSEYLLELVEKNYGKLDEKHVYNMLNRLYTMAKKLETSPMEEYITALNKDSRFQTLCVLLAKNGRFYNHNWVLNIISKLSFLGLDSDSNAMQVFLQLSKFLINDLTLAQVVHYGFILNALKENQHTEVLKEALEKCALLKFDEIVQLNIRHQAQFLKLFGSNLDENQLHIVSQAILASKERFNIPSLLVIMESISSFGFQDRDLNKLCISEAISKLPILLPESVLDILQYCSRLNIYHTILYRNICQKVIDEQWNVENTLKVCDYLTIFKFRHVDIVNHLCCSLLADTDIFEELTSDDVSMIARVLGELNGKVQGVSEVLGYIVRRMEDSLWLSYSADHLARIMRDLAIRRVYSTTLFQHLAIKLQTKDVEDMCESTEPEVARIARQLTFNLCMLKMAARVEHGDLTTIRIPSGLTQHFSPKPNAKTWTQMRNLINSAFEGETFVRSGLLTTYGIYIDNVLVLDGENNPVDLWTDEGCSEMVDGKFVYKNRQNLSTVPENHKVVAVLMFTNGHFYRNISMLRGRFMFYIRILRQMGYSPVVVKYTDLKYMPDIERGPYLKRLLQNAGELQDFVQE